MSWSRLIGLVYPTASMAMARRGDRPHICCQPAAVYRLDVVLADQDLAIAAAEAGAAVVRSRFGHSLARFEKSPGDFATAADIESEKAVLDVLRAYRPDDAVAGEESGFTTASHTDRTWLVDPLCGTVNYAARTNLVAVNVALRTGTGITVAVSADPFAQELFWAVGGRAYVRRGGVDEEIAPSAASRLVDVNLDAPFPNNNCVADCATAERRTVRPTVPSACGLHNAGGGVGRSRQAGRLCDRGRPA